MENDNTNNVQTGAEGTTETAKTYTQDEVNALLQSETDKRVQQALKTQARKNEAKIREAEKLAKMNEAEKYEYELEQREKAIEAKERELALSENKNEASKILSEKGISLELVDFVVAEDADTMKSNIDRLNKAFKASVKAEVERRLTTSIPKKNLGAIETVTKDTLLKMSTKELTRFKAENPDEYNRIMNT